MKLRSWNRFKTRGLTVDPKLMGRELSFTRDGVRVAISIPPLSTVSTSGLDEQARAVRGSYRSDTGEPLSFHINAIDVRTDVAEEVDLPDAILDRHTNASDLVDKPTQARLNSLCNFGKSAASSAFEYWLSVMRWVTNFHWVGREVRLGFESGWSTYLHEAGTDKDVWAYRVRTAFVSDHIVTAEHWQQLERHLSSSDEPPIHVMLLHDARHCIDIGDYRRAVVDLSVACEVYLRTAVVESLPPGVVDDVVRLVEEANINQHASHMFPALLSDSGRDQYKKNVKDDLSSLFARRNKLMHVAASDGVDEVSCRRYQRALEQLFLLERKS